MPRMGMSFDGNDYVNVPDSASIRIAGSVTVSVWVYVSSPNSDAPLIRKGLPPNRQYEVYLGYVDDKFIAGADPPVGWIYSPPGSLSSRFRNWIHVVYVRDKDGGKHKILVNLQVLASGTFTPGTNAPSDTISLRIGQYLNGSVDEACIYNRPLSDFEILRLYRGLDVPDGLVLHLDFEKERGSDGANRIRDLSPYGNHGTNYGARQVPIPDFPPLAKRRI